MRLSAGIWSDDNDLQSLCALGRAWGLERLFREVAARGHSTDVQMIDSTHVKAHCSSSATKKGERTQTIGRSCGGCDTKIHAVAVLRSGFELKLDVYKPF